jgi:hypothetical protein
MNFTYENEDGEEITVRLPSEIVVCGRCGGRGVHDAWEGGMTASEMDEQGPEFFDDYMAGHYDKICTECHGRNVQEVVDEDALEKNNPELFEIWCDYQQQMYDHWAEVQAEQRMGA